MTSFKFKFAVISAVAMLSAPSFAAWETLPVTGFPVTGTGAGTHQPTGGTTPYRICNPNGNYGSVAIVPDSPVCKAPVPTIANLNTPPQTGFTLLRTASRPIVMNNALTGGANVNLGTVQDRVFRNSATNECIFGTQVYLTLATDHFVNLPGNLTFEVNGIARGGFANSGTVSISHAKVSGIDSETLFRAGRTLQTVQHRATVAVNGSTFAPGYYNLPVTSTTSLASIVGDASTALNVPTLLQQSANLNPNWVEFTTDANSNDPDDGPAASDPVSPAVYVKTSCTAAQIPTATAVNDAIRLRMAWQEQGPLVQAFVEVRVPAFVPVGGNALPAVVPGSTF